MPSFSGLKRWLRQPSKHRVAVLAVCSVVLLSLALVGFVSANTPHMAVNSDPPERNTLIGLQSYHNDGRALEVTPNGTVVWEYSTVENVFDVEALSPNRVQIAGADALPDRKCPERFVDDGFAGCAYNSVRIVSQETNETRWKYGWYDVERHEHELHDVDHYTVAGEDRWVLVDMGNDRVFAIDRSGKILWQWNANSTYDRPPSIGVEDDWTHMNDVDRIGKRTFQVSLRNFDTVVELRVAPNGSVSVTPLVGPNRFTPEGSAGPLAAQHNPDRLAEGHLLVADSENDRVVEFNSDGDIVWEVGGSGRFDWPRDADRLSNGHTLITDSYNGRIVEVNSQGKIVWALETKDLPYEADRIPRDGAGEGSTPRPIANGETFDSRTNATNSIVNTLQYGATLVKYTVPGWLGSPGLLLGGVLCGLGALIETRRWRRTMNEKET
ncbi:MAG TPA: hypothetical protein VFJ06_02900 [Halococcus sp.]|nr:hypothetical protein [Halococcus sp.]